MNIDEWADLHGETRMTMRQFEIEERRAEMLREEEEIENQELNEFDVFAKTAEIKKLHNEYDEVVKKVNYAYIVLSNGEVGPAMEALEEIPERLGERQDEYRT